MPRLKPKPWMVLTAVLALLVIAFFSTFYIIGGHESTAVENIAGAAAAPVVSGANGFAISVRDFFDRLFGLRDIDREYKQMQIRIQQLEAANQFMLDLQQENERLNKLLGFEEQYPDFTYIPARVIAKEPGSWFINFELNRGSAQGVKKDNTVVNEYGLIGKVIDVGANTCKVMAIIDRQSSVSIIIERSRDNGMVDGSEDSQSSKPICTIENLPNDAEIVPGDRVLTTDFGGYYPKGLPVGEVSTVYRGEKQESKAEMKPYVDFAHIENVLIINGTRDTHTEDKTEQEQTTQGKTGEPEN